MKSHPAPKIPVQDIFYLRQLWVNCFGVNNFKSSKSEMLVYHEGEAHKAANEVYGMLLKYFTFLSMDAPTRIVITHSLDSFLR